VAPFSSHNRRLITSDISGLSLNEDVQSLFLDSPVNGILIEHLQFIP